MPQDTESRSPYMVRLIPALDHIEQHLAERLPLGQLALLAGLSLWRFATVFRQEVGISPHRYITLRRLLFAQRLLAQGHAPSRVAVASGFYDQSHLTRCLKSRCGMTPRQYQDQHLRYPVRHQPGAETEPSFFVPPLTENPSWPSPISKS